MKGVGISVAWGAVGGFKIVWEEGLFLKTPVCCLLCLHFFHDVIPVGHVYHAIGQAVPTYNTLLPTGIDPVDHFGVIHPKQMEVSEETLRCYTRDRL